MSANASAPIPLLERMFYYMRHGETESNRLQTIAGSTDVALNDTGRSQARAAVELVRPLGITLVVSSAQLRARDTATVVAEALMLPRVVLPGLAERNWGELEGKPRALRVRGVTPPGAETAEQHVSRTRAALGEIAAGGTPLVVAHSGTVRVLCRLLALEAPPEPVANCRPVRFAPSPREGGGWTIEML
ncbi:MAG: histidine phosphatase family protein [Betaproteobacteria bacterium]|nr:histidine phosphatase family protein [Betaproteobacteria bacterium]